MFDLDGTLVNSAPAILKCFRRILELNDLTAAVEIDNSLIGPPLLETVSRFTGVDDCDRLEGFINDFRDCYDGGVVFETPFYDGVLDSLAQLHSAGVEMHIATNKRLAPTLAILEKLKCSHFFKSVYSLDMKMPRIKNKAEMLSLQLAEKKLRSENVIYIGDKKEDGDAADANRLEFYYADWGYGDLIQSQIPSHWRWLESPAMICRLIKS